MIRTLKSKTISLLFLAIQVLVIAPGYAQNNDCAHGGKFEYVSEEDVNLCFPEKVNLINFKEADLAAYSKSSDLFIFAWLSVVEPSWPYRLTQRELESIAVVFWQDPANISSWDMLPPGKPSTLKAQWHLSWAPLNGNEGVVCSLFYGKSKGIMGSSRILYCAAVREGKTQSEVEEKFLKFLASVKVK
ncbi:hypothetical protein [Pseudomonas sp. BF-RE-26]|uniref:hypothetical protein n=1 Tax=Pseudomonas sp. BF-RE-26 TaxID=2832396 RepID=UPI001CBB5DE7|nr:hypothetical protein [Pseudomonas sp. BF-RE-26]